MNKIFFACLFAGIFLPSSSLTGTRRRPYFDSNGSDDTEEVDDYLDDLQANPLLSSTDYKEDYAPCNLQQGTTFEHENQYESINELTSDLEPENYETSNEDSSGIQLELIDEEDEEGKIDEWKEAQAKHFINTDAQDYAEPIEQQLPYQNYEMEYETTRPALNSYPIVSPEIRELLKQRERREQQAMRERNRQEQLKLKEQQRLRYYEIQRAEYLKKLREQQTLLFYQKHQAQTRAARKDPLQGLTPQQKAYYKRGLGSKKRRAYLYI